MRIYRGNVGIEMSLHEFSDIVASEELVDDMLNLLEVLEIEQAMQYSDEEIEQFEEQLFREMEERKRMIEEETESNMMKRVLDHLKHYE